MALILVIDNSETMRHLVRRMLERVAHRVIEAEDGKAGLVMFEDQAPALVITDLIMPRMEGIETIQQMRRSAPNTKIIAMSGIAETRATMYLGAARKLGADATLTKPFSGAALLDLVDRLLNAGWTDHERPAMGC